MESTWCWELEQLVKEHRTAVACSVYHCNTFVQLFGCIDSRCGEQVYSRLPFKHHRILGAHIGDRNGNKVVDRLDHDARRAQRQNPPHGLRQLLICETHEDCIWRQRQGLREDVVWASFQRWCHRLPQTDVVWISRHEESGAVKIHGVNGVVDVGQLYRDHEDCSAALCAERLNRVGVASDPDVVHDLTLLIQGNFGYLSQRRQAMPVVPRRVVIGSGVPGAPGHFSISDRMEDVEQALPLALELLRQRHLDHAIQVIVIIPWNPDKPGSRAVAETNLRRLRLQARAIVSRLNVEREIRIYAALVVKGQMDFIPY